MLDPQRSKKRSQNKNSSNLWSFLPVSVSFGLVLVRSDKSEKQRGKERKENPSPMPFQNLSKFKETLSVITQ